jgi:hypothetical protein
MSDPQKVCVPYFHFVAFFTTFIALIIWLGWYILQYTQFLVSFNLDKDKETYAPISPVVTTSPAINPNVADDLMVGELPPARRDYRKMFDPLKGASQRYTPDPIYNTTPGPFNQNTQGYYSGNQLMGYLTVEGDPDKMLKLFGRRTDRQRYEYYTMHHNDQQIKIPIKNRGDQELIEGDDIKVPGYDDKFIVNLYQYETPRYLPFV